jgi:phosphohistidine phosphatase SixA
VLEYLMGEDLDENCVNYIAKTLQVVIRKRLGALLEYMRACPDMLARLAHLSHFPAIAQILAKFITDEDEHMSEPAHEARKMVIPLLLQKLHKELALSSSAEVLDCLGQILQASRYSDP